MSHQETEKSELDEGYVKDHYNKGLKQMEENYNDRRWFSSTEASFDHAQTKYVLMHTLKQREYETALEVGPGDGVWTRFFASKIKKLTLLDQSEEMIARAKKALAEYSHIDYRIDNFATADIAKGTYNLIVAVRCFEYIIDKADAVKKFATALAPGGRMVLITKNPNYRTLKNWKPTLLHTKQINKKDLVKMFKNENLIVEAVYPAVFRWKSSYGIFRFLFSALQKLAVVSGGRLYIPFLTDWATESYAYVVRKEKLVVELYGLPGSGKSTLARELEGQNGNVKRLRPVRRGWGMVRFILGHPGVFFYWVKEMFLSTLKSGDWTFFRYRMAILLGTFEELGKLTETSEGMIVLEEGLIQRICSVYERKLSPEELEPLLSRTPINSVLVVVDATDKQFNRYNHPSNPRGQRGEDYMREFKEMLIHNHGSLLTALESWKGKRMDYGRESNSSNFYNQLVSL